MITKFLCVILLLSFQVAAQDQGPVVPEANPTSIEKEQEKTQEKTNEIKQEESQEKDNTSPKAIAKIIRGEVYFINEATDGQAVKEVPIANGDEIQIGKTITTKEKSFAQLVLPDETILNIGPDSQMMIEKFELSEHRKVSITHLKGQVRSIINRKNKDGNDSWKLNTRTISVGVRGTEFLSNTYSVASQSTTDVALLKGEVLADVSKTSSSLKEVTLKPGQFFNSSELASKGEEAIKTLSQEALEGLQKNTESFLPKLQDLGGNFIDLEKTLRADLGLPPITALAGVAAATGALLPTLGGGNENDDKDEAPVVVQRPKEKKEDLPKSRVVIKTSKHKELKDQPWDIRDAIINANEKRVDNICYFWFYKSIPGSGDLERFRRERQCEEYEF